MEQELTCAIRDPILYQKLKAHDPSEDAVLRGEKPAHGWEFSSSSHTCIDYRKMPYGDKLVSVVRHPRFEHIPKHKHNFIEACYVCSGEIVHMIEGKQICLHAGDFLMMNQFTCHEVLPAGENDVAVNFIIQARFFDDAYELAAKRNVLSDFIVDLLRQEVNCNQYLHFQTLTHLPVSHLLEIILTNFFPHDDDDTIQRHNRNMEDDELNKALMFLAFRYLSKDLSDLNVDAPMNYDEIMLSTVRKYIDDTYQRASLTELAEIMNQSVSALSRQIKQISGYTFKELLQNKRFDRAVKLLEETNLAVSDIALAVGYENSSYFYRRFREIYGISPRIYREKAQNRINLPNCSESETDVIII